MAAFAYPEPFSIAFDETPGVLTLTFTGAVHTADLYKARDALIEQVSGRTVLGIVLDARASTPRYSAGDLIESVEQTLDFITPKRCAFVSEAPRPEEIMLIETVSFPYAVRVQAFSSPDSARDWVLAAA